MHDEVLQLALMLLFILVFALTAIMIYIRIYGMVRIYNWNGKRYCYLGTTMIGKESDGFFVKISERMVDLSHTTLYRICPSRIFCRRNRYQDMFVYADRDRRHIVIGMEPMKTEVPF